MSWSESDDKKIWSLRSKPTSQLAITFNKTSGAIRSRLKHLQDPTHKAYRRRVKNGAATNSSSMFASKSNVGAPSSRSSISMMSPFATGYMAAAEALSSSTTKKRSSSSISGIGSSNNNMMSALKKKSKSSSGVIDLCSSDDDDSPLISHATKSKQSNNMMSSFAAQYTAARTNSDTQSNLKMPATSKQSNKGRIDSSTLNSDQQKASAYIINGGNAFLTGAAGVGKSYLLNYVIQGLRDKHGGHSSSSNSGSYRGQRYNNTTAAPAVVVAAATGIAATHINGMTIHSWAGVQLGVGGPSKLVPRVLNNAAACNRWRKAKVLVLDEVSMIDGIFFEALDAIGREVRNCKHRPFGGLQLVLSGVSYVDVKVCIRCVHFSHQYTLSSSSTLYETYQDFFQLPPVSLNRCGFAFESTAWRNAAVKMVELRTVVRQSGDQTFINLLNQIRIGQCPNSITNALEACHVSRKALPSDGIVPTKLYCTNKNVDEENNRKLAQLPTKEVVFRATDEYKGNYNQSQQNSLSQTMDKKTPSEIRLKVGAQVILTRNMPSNNLVNGSRGVVKGFSDGDEDEVTSNYGKKKSSGSSKAFPVVHFSNGVKMVVTEESVFQGSAAGAMTRNQLPLKLAWSLTVHKSQGMTIERAELQLDDAFDFGQVYVALSRVTSLDGLWVRGGRITQTVVKAHPKVKSFYKQNGSTVCDDDDQQQLSFEASGSTSEYSSASGSNDVSSSASSGRKPRAPRAPRDPSKSKRKPRAPRDPSKSKRKPRTPRSSTSSTNNDDSDLYDNVFNV